MRETIYKHLQNKIIALTLVVSFMPLLILGLTMYYQFEKTSKENIDEQIRYRAIIQADAVERFLKGRTAILASIADTHNFATLTNEKQLSRFLEIMNSRAGGFVDLGIIDDKGNHITYVGPYDLKYKNYYDQSWFGEVASKGLYVSDVYLGFRKMPHFVIAVRRLENQKMWILRATINPVVLEKIMRRAHIGKTGDAYLVSRNGIYQTQPRFDGSILGNFDLDMQQFGSNVEIVELKPFQGRSLYYVGMWIREHKWLLVIRQEPAELSSSLLTVKYTEIFIITLGFIGIVLTTIFTTRLSIQQLKQAETRMNELNAYVIQSDKMAALGKMAAGVAHEINNPLAVIIQNTGWMEDLLEEEEFQDSPNYQEFKTTIDKIEEHVERARKVVHDMLGYARKMEPKQEEIDVNGILTKTIEIVDHYAKNNNIALQTTLASDVPITTGDQSQLQQVFLNLITNAIDAIENDGVITLSTAHNASKIIVQIRDNGRGITKDMQKKIFDPFFTTKDTGKGTGLGLWVTYSIIDKMGGNIRCESESGVGTTFTVTIPVVEPEKQ